ncbi:MAG TPA: type 4a pilus biogenesis protein PilO [Phycisphaerales bacterium]|nr:type 4a pilus biogenesis protein PilO [Phycisphaerales bacterium]
MSEATNNVRGGSIPPKAVHAVGAGAALALGAVFVMAVLAPVQAKRAHASADEARLLEARNALAATDEKIESARRQILSLQQQLDDSVQLQSADNVNRVVKQLTDAAIEAQLKVLDVTPGERERESKDFSVVPIRLTATGSFAHALAFLHESNAKFRDTATRELSVRRLDGGNDVQIVMELAWYTLPGEQTARSGRDGRAGGSGGESK